IQPNARAPAYPSTARSTPAYPEDHVLGVVGEKGYYSLTPDLLEKFQAQRLLPDPLTVAAALRPARPEAPRTGANWEGPDVPATAETPASTPEKRDPDDKDDKPPAPRRPGRPATVLASQAVERLRKAGGKASGSLTTNATHVLFSCG